MIPDVCFQCGHERRCHDDEWGCESLRLGMALRCDCAAWEAPDMHGPDAVPTWQFRGD